MYRIIWRKNGFGIGRTITQWTKGISTYTTVAQSEKQVKLFKYIFPTNVYIIERI